MSTTRRLGLLVGFAATRARQWGAVAAAGHRRDGCVPRRDRL